MQRIASSFLRLFANSSAASNLTDNEARSNIQRGSASKPYRSVGLARETEILVESGYRRVDSLRVGDRAQTLMGRGPLFTAIQWIGARAQAPGSKLILIQREAIAVNMPIADVLLAPEQGIYIDRKFYLPRQLINGASIRIVSDYRPRIYVIELPSHDAIVANGMPIESYLEEGARSDFEACGRSAFSHDIPVHRKEPQHPS